MILFVWGAGGVETCFFPEWILLWTDLCLLQNLYVGALIHNVTIFGDKAFLDVLGLCH